MPSFNYTYHQTEISVISDQNYDVFKFFRHKNGCSVNNTSKNSHVTCLRSIRNNNIVGFSYPYHPSYKTTKHIDQSSVLVGIFPMKDISILNKQIKFFCDDLTR